jgi:SAM-dependent methyltransferase
MNKGSQRSVLDFWDERAGLGERAGTNDFVLTELEQRFLVDFIPAASRVLDIGCGNGGSLIRLARESGVSGVGFDFSPKMIETAVASVAGMAGLDRLAFYHRIAPPVPLEWGRFPIAYSQRCFINLPNVEAQRQAVLSVADVLVPGGVYVMIECFNEGAEETNLLRQRLGLPRMSAPWHNLFFNLQEVKSWSTPDFCVERVFHISSTYHFLSRVIYAKLAERTGEALRYDSDINLLAAQLPQEIGEFGPVKACVWRKAR